MRIRVSSRFEKNYRKLPRKIKIKAKQKEAIFRTNPFDSRLKTHKLKGEKQDSFAFWIDYSYRIEFIFLNKSEILFFNIGTHNIYK